MSSSSQKSIENEMISIKHRYLEIQEQLAMAEKVFVCWLFTFNKLFNIPIFKCRNWRKNSIKQTHTKI